MSGGGIDGQLRERRLSAILAADVVGYSRLMGADEDGTLRSLNDHRRELIDPAVATHRGRIVKTTGDGMMVEFASAVDAVRCGVDVQRGMAERNEAVRPERRIEYRIGINVGDIIGVGDDIYGDGVNIAARLEAMSEPGSIYVSRTVRDPVVDKLAFGFEDLGEMAAKNIARPIHVFRVRYDSEAARRSVALLPFERRAVIAGIALLAVVGAGASTWFWGMRHSGNVPPNSAALVGRRQGIWNNNPVWTATLIVESVSQTGQVRGSLAFMFEDAAKFLASITDSTISFGGPIKFTFRLRPDGKLEGTRNAAGQLDTTVLTKLMAFYPGRWDGIWNNDPQATTSLTIESVTPVGEVTGSYIFMSGAPSRFIARATDDTISFGSPNKFTFKARSDGKMEGTRNAAGQLDTAILTNLAAFSPGRWEGIWGNDPRAMALLTIDSVSATGDAIGSYVYMSRSPVRFMTRIVDNTISFGGTVKFTFKLRPDGKVEATRNNSGALDTSVFVRG